uniref:Uncharacterized protein n=1 Tax=Cannabis sativa TaxID=3483 RepID=A0A803QD37_CANSA
MRKTFTSTATTTTDDSHTPFPSTGLSRMAELSSPQMRLRLESISMECWRMAYPYRYKLYKRVDEPSVKEKYVILL